MARPSSLRALSVWMNGERVGTWGVTPGKPDEFAYVPEWLAAEAARPISLSMPLRPTAYRGDVVGAYFDNLLPDSRSIRERLQRRFGTATVRPFDLLAEIGRDCAGAIQLLPGDAEAPKVNKIEGTPITAKRIERHLADVTRPTLGRLDDDGDFRFSVAGAQEKTALLRLDGEWMVPKGTTPTTHLLKLPIGTGGGGIDLSTSVENEWLCAQIMRAFGEPVADCSIERFGEQKVLVVERFDRRRSSNGRWIVRLPAEDLCQATGVPGSKKYEADGGPGIRTIMTLLLGSSAAHEDRRRFFRTQMLFWMLCSIDGHARNFSVFLEAGGSYRLTPLYDVLSAFPVLGTAAGKLQLRKVKMAMGVEGTRKHYRWHEILPRHWKDTAQRCGLASEIGALVGELVGRTDAVIQTVSSKIPKGFPDAVSGPVIEGLKNSSRKLATIA